MQLDPHKNLPHLLQMSRRIPLLCLLLPLALLGHSLHADNSKRLELYYGIAEGNYLIGDLQGARRGIQQILKLDPNYLPALELQARVQLQAGETEDALASTQAALKVAPENLELQVLAARIRGDEAGAVAAIDEVLSVYTDNAQPGALQQRTSLRIMRAQALAQNGDPEAAIRELQALTGQQPDNIEATITLASLYASAGRWSSLEALLPKLSAQPQLQDIALYFEGRALLARDRVGSAREKFEAALERSVLGTLATSLHFYRGVCLDRLGRQAEAQAELLAALEAGFRPETPSEVTRAARSLLQAQEPQRAIALLEALTLNQPASSAEAWALLGRAHCATGNGALAISALNQSLQLQPQQAEVRALRAGELRKMGDLTGATADYEAARILAPTNPAYLYALGLLQLQLGKIPAAEQNLGLASRLLPDNHGLSLIHALLAHAIQAPETAHNALQHYLQATQERSNESAFFLEYILSPTAGLPRLQQRASQPEASTTLVNFSAYCAGKLDRKGLLDAAGVATDSATAQQQIAEVCFWAAQVAQKQGQPQQAHGWLQLCLDTQQVDQIEYQLARWQLNHSLGHSK